MDFTSKYIFQAKRMPIKRAFMIMLNYFQTQVNHHNLIVVKPASFVVNCCCSSVSVRVHLQRKKKKDQDVAGAEA